MEKKLQAEWLARIGEAKTRAELDVTADSWMQSLRSAALYKGSLGFEFYVMSHQWDNAKSSLIRSFGRDAPESRHLIEFISAVIDQRRFLK